MSIVSFQLDENGMFNKSIPINEGNLSKSCINGKTFLKCSENNFIETNLFTGEIEKKYSIKCGNDSILHFKADSEVVVAGTKHGSIFIWFLKFIFLKKFLKFIFN